jgi:hypothetical protein
LLYLVLLFPLLTGKAILLYLVISPLPFRRGLGGGDQITHFLNYFSNEKTLFIKTTSPLSPPKRRGSFYFYSPLK